MSVFMHTLQQMLVLFILVFAGLVARRFHIMDDEFDRRLSSLVMTFALPAMILDSVLGSESLPSADVIVRMLVCSFACYVLLVVLAELVVHTLYVRVDASSRGVQAFAIVFGNVGFMGFPVVSSVFGSQAVFYAALFNIPFNLFVFTYGAFALRRGADTRSDDARDKPQNPSTLKTVLKGAVNPSLVAALVAIVLALCDVTDPDGVLGNACACLGQLTTPASLLVIGSSLGKMTLADVLGHVRPYLTSLIRLLLVPLVVHALFGLVLQDALSLGVMTICAGMPVASMGTMLCLLHGSDTEGMVQVTFTSTVLSLITIPLIALLVI